MTPIHSTTEAPFSIERMSFGESPTPPQAVTPPEPAGAAEEGPAAGRVLQQFADDIGRALYTALHELDRQRDIAGASSLRKLAAQVEFLTATVSEQGSGVNAALEKCDGLAAQLQRADGAREAATASLRQQNNEMSARVIAVVERLDRHAEALRSFVDARQRMAESLRHVVALVTSLEEVSPPALSESL